MPLRCAERPCHLPRVTGARSDVADLAMVHEMIERGEGLLDGNRALEAVDLVEIYGIDSEAAQARLAALDDVFARDASHVGGVAHWEMDLGCEYDLVHVRH